MIKLFFLLPLLFQNIAVVDTGITKDGLELNCSNVNYDLSYNFLHNNKDVEDSHGHGSQLSALIAGCNIGRCKNCDIVAIKASEKGNLPSSAVIEAIRYLQTIDVKVVNLSFTSPVFSPLFEEELLKLEEKAVVVVSSGNWGLELPPYYIYPASFNHRNMVVVTGVETDLILSPLSNHGRTIVDVGAPIASYVPTLSSYTIAYGTSFSTAIVSGEIGKLFTNRPNLKPYRAIRIFYKRSRKIKDLRRYISRGRIII